MRKYFWIYRITNTINGKFYIGQTNDIYKRKSAHKLSHKSDSYIANSIKKYGWENHAFDILFFSKNIPIIVANQIEVYFIRFYNSQFPINKLGLNLTEGGYNIAQSKEHLDKMVTTKFYTWKKKIGKENIAIEVYDKSTKKLIIKHYGTPIELFKILGLENRLRLTTLLTNNLKRGGGLFRKKFLVQWEGQNKVAEYSERKIKEIDRLRKAPLTEKRLKALRPRTDFSNTSIKVKNLITGDFFPSIKAFSKSEGIKPASVYKRFKAGKYNNRYEILKSA